MKVAVCIEGCPVLGALSLMFSLFSQQDTGKGIDTLAGACPRRPLDANHSDGDHVKLMYDM